MPRLNIRCSFPVWCLGQYVQFDCIGSWSSPFNYISFRLKTYIEYTCEVSFCFVQYNFGSGIGTFVLTHLYIRDFWNQKIDIVSHSMQFKEKTYVEWTLLPLQDASIMSVNITKSSEHASRLILCFKYRKECRLFQFAGTEEARTTGDRTFKTVPGIHGIPGNLPIRILLWYANFQA